MVPAAQKEPVVKEIVIILLALLVGLACGLLFWQAGGEGEGTIPEIETVYVPSAVLQEYILPGEFSAEETGTVLSPRTTAHVATPFYVMKYQVSREEYARCVADGACAAVEEHAHSDTRMPVTGVNYQDAQAYAQWLARVTGRAWRLPSDLEWVHFAQVEPEQPEEQRAADTPEDWTDLWIQRYREESSRTRESIRQVYPAGKFGVNDMGVADIGGNVWEWTHDCFERVRLDRSGAVLSRQPSCSIRVLQGQHRAYIPDFIRDASSGGCGTGLPPDYLGIRLVYNAP